MNYIIVLISLIILSTIGIQFFWNYDSYQTNKFLLSNEVQNGFDEAIEKYYTEVSENSTVSFFDLQSESGTSADRTLDFLEIGKLFKGMDSTTTEIPNLPSDSILLDSFDVKIVRGKPTRETEIKLKNYKNSFTITIPQDSIDFSALSKLLDTVLLQKKIKTSYAIDHYKSNSVFAKTAALLINKDIIEISSKSKLIPVGEALKLRFTNPISSIFQRGLIGILLSLFLALGIVFSLFYLMRIIRKQKHLSEIKNDLISNITHEFKTPIATVLAAIEGITDFNSKNHDEKTKKYLQISKGQLNRLNTMVEKLLETAAINSESLELQKTTTDIIPLVEKIIIAAKTNYSDKNFEFQSSIQSKEYDIDTFHFENVINNIIDNAAKYGGDKINVTLNKSNELLVISIIDNGKGISTIEQERIFDKFYRIPSGNRHNVKGFGIGLYYSKNIILKHGGKLDLISTKNSNEFQISL